MKVSIDPNTNLQTEEANPYAAITGTKVQATYGNDRYVTDSPVSYNYDSMNFAGMYKDKVSDYRKYGVPTSRYFNWDEERAKNQGTGEKWLHGLTKAGVTTLGAVAENTLGIAFGLGELATGGAYYDNFIGKSIDKMNENMREAFPNYRTQEEQDMSTGQKLGTANFWADTVANGFGYSLGSLATIYLTGGVGLIGRGAKAMQIYNTAKALSTGTKIASAVGKGSTFTRQGFVNAANMAEMGLYMSLAESSVEARENQKSTYESLIALEMEAQGLTDQSQLSAVDLKAIEDASYASGNRHFLTQLPVLMGSNLFMFGKQVTGFKGAFSGNINKDVAFNAALNKTVSTVANQGKYRNALSRLRPFAADAVTEAGQEGWQFASGIMSTDYHTDKYFNGGAADLTESLYKGISETLGTQEGLESMLVGAIVGGGMGGVSSAVSKPFKQRKAAADYATALINGGFMDNANNQMLGHNAKSRVVTAMENALKEVMPDGTVGNIKAFKDAQFKLIQYNAFAAIQNGTFNVFKEKLKDSKSLSDVEFAKAFGYNTELTIEEQTGGQSKTDVIKNLEEKLDKFEKVYDNVNQMFPSIPKSQGLTRLRKSEAEQKAEDAVYNKRENLRADLILSASTIENKSERLESIQKQMKAVIERGSKLNGVNIESDIDLILNPGEDLLEVKDGKYDAETELNIIIKGLDEIKQKMINKGVTAEVAAFDKLSQDYIELFADSSIAIDRYNKLASSKYFQDLFEETVKANQAEAKQAAKDQKVKEDIESATTSEDARKAAPDDASPEAQVAARKKAKELEKEEKAAELKYLKLNKDKPIKDRLKSLQYIAANEDLSPTEKAGLAMAIKLLENKVKNESNEDPKIEEEEQAVTMTGDNIVRTKNDEKIKGTEPKKRVVESFGNTSAAETDPVTTSTGELNVVAATNTDEVINAGTPEDPIYKIPVDSQGTPIEKDPDQLNGKPILLQPELLLKEDILAEEIEFEIIENDYYTSDRLNKAEESWTEIPIYYKIGNAYIGKLEASNNEDRKAIVDKLLRGDKVTTQISQILATNFNNSIDSETNEFYFHNPKEVFGKDDDILIAISQPEIAGDPKTGQWSLNTVHPDKNKNDELDNINTDITREVTDKFNNQVGIVIKKENNPAGKARISIAMTSNLNSLANEMVIKYLSEKNYEAAQMIVANSKNRKSANTNNSYLEFGAFESGQKYIVYKSPKLGKLIRINEDEFVKAINKDKTAFQIVTEKDEKLTGRKPNTTESKIDVVEDLSNFLSTKKYQVDKALMNSKVHTKENPYISPVTGIPHDTYQDYLFDSKELGNEPRIQDAGYNSILSTDIVKKRESMFNSPRVTFKKGNILGETAGEIIKNTKIAEPSPGAPVAPTLNYTKVNNINIRSSNITKLKVIGKIGNKIVLEGKFDKSGNMMVNKNKQNADRVEEVIKFILSGESATTQSKEVVKTIKSELALNLEFEMEQEAPVAPQQTSEVERLQKESNLLAYHYLKQKQGINNPYGSDTTMITSELGLAFKEAEALVKKRISLIKPKGWKLGDKYNTSELDKQVSDILSEEAPVVPKTELSSLVSAWLQTPEGSLKNQTVEQSAGKFAIEYAKRNKLTEGLTEQQVTEQAGSLLFGTVAQGLTVMQTVQQEIENQSKQIEAPVAPGEFKEAVSLDQVLTKTQEKAIKQMKELYPEIKIGFTQDGKSFEVGDNKTIMNQEEIASLSYKLKSVSILSSDRAKQVFAKGKNNGWDLNKILTELAIPKEQKQLILDKGITNREEIITSLLADNSFAVEVNTATELNDIDTEYVDGFINGNVEIANYEIIFYEGNTFKIGEESDGTPILDKDHDVYYHTELGKKIFHTKEEYLVQEKNRKNNEIPTQYYSNLTVPGGTNYTENEISTPAITPTIRGHAKFSTDNGIGWFRSDDKTIKIGEEIKDVNFSDLPSGIDDQFEKRTFDINKLDKTKTRRILEVQSDLFQKGRDNKNLITKTMQVAGAPIEEVDMTSLRVKEEDIGYSIVDKDDNYLTRIGFNTKKEAEDKLKALKEDPTATQNTFLQLLNKKGNWVNFFLQSIVQDSVKKGYEKVVFPTGETVARVEGHQTIVDEIKKIDKEIAQIKSRVYRLGDEIDDPAFYNAPEGVMETILLDEGTIADFKKMNQQHINRLEKAKVDMKTQGIEKLKPIEAFYTNRVTNILNKLYDVKKVTDEHGNTWNEVDLSQEKTKQEILLQQDKKGNIKGQANIDAMTVLFDKSKMSDDTVYHEYAHHYVAWNRSAPIVQEAINKWGSEEALVQAIGEQSLKQKGEAWTWFKKFMAWLKGDINKLSKLDAKQLRNILTDAFLTRQDLKVAKKKTFKRGKKSGAIVNNLSQKCKGK